MNFPCVARYPQLMSVYDYPLLGFAKRCWKLFLFIMQAYFIWYDFQNILKFHRIWSRSSPILPWRPLRSVLVKLCHRVFVRPIIGSQPSTRRLDSAVTGYNPLPADTQTAAANQNTSNTNSWSEDISPVSASSTYNFRESTRKRSLDTNEARDCHVTGEDKSSRKESPRKKDGRGSFFVPGMYKDTSFWTSCTIIRDVFALWCTTLLT